MDIEQLNRVLDKFRNLPKVGKEKTFFDIGARGHFENPTTDVLAFFCNGEEQHGMDNLISNSIIKLIGKKLNRNLIESEIPIIASREVATKQGKRIDLVIDSEDYLIIIEMKVNHFQVNPFKEYENYAFSEIASSKKEKTAKESKEPIFVILSPSGVVDDSHNNHLWVGISFGELKEAVSENLHTHFITNPLDKWIFILRDFLLHLETLSMSEKISENSSFALENLSEISRMWDLLNDALKGINNQIYQQCIEKYSDSFSYRKANWFGLPTYIYTLTGSNVDVVFFSSSESMSTKRSEGKYIYLQLQVDTREKPSLLDDLKNKLIDKTPDESIYQDGAGGWLRWPIQHYSDVDKEMINVLDIIKNVELLD